MERILAGIVLYNPEKDRLMENLQSIYPQVDRLVLVDNGSNNFDAVYPIFPKDAVVIKNGKNLGIATALNQIVQYALDHDYEWALTLDQDSVSADNIGEIYRKCIESISANVGMICCDIKDRNAIFSSKTNHGEVSQFVELCITSASMIRVSAWQKVGGFDDSMFIDSVDFDICINLRQNGWKIFKTSDTHIIHEVGHSKVIKIFGKEYLSLNHSPLRYYYIARNNVYLGRKYGMLLRNLKVIARILWTVLRYEKYKIDKTTKIVKGMAAGFCCPIVQPTERKKND